MKPHHILGAMVGCTLLAIWALMFMVLCRVSTGYWWLTDKEIAS